jgi:predicted RecB family nuclease
MRINSTIFLSYLLCPYKAKLLLSNQPASTTECQIMLDDIARRYKSIAEVAVSQVVPKGEISCASVGGPCLIGDGASLILDTTVEIGNFEFHFDALMRSPRAHTASTTHYKPVLFHHGDAVPVSQQLLLAFGGYVLGQAQGWYPTTGIIVHGPECSLRSVFLTPKHPRVEIIAAALTALSTKDQQMQLLLNSNCGTCVFQSRCFAQAKAEDNLTLLSRMTEKTVRQYARKGIFTTTQLSYTFPPQTPVEKGEGSWPPSQLRPAGIGHPRAKSLHLGSASTAVNSNAHLC